MPRFSVITVTRNNLDGLIRTRQSLYAQNFSDYEWIVIDGASTDATVAFLENQGQIWISEPDGGIYDAMNKGIDRATGDYLLFLNAGDTLATPDTLEKIAAIDAAFIYGDSLENGHYKTARSHNKVLSGMFTHHQAMIYRREIIGALRYDPDYRIAADYKFTLQFLKNVRDIHYIPAPLCVFETGGISQRQTAQGRKEQFKTRRELRACGPVENAFIFGAQILAQTLRRLAPGLYWLLRSSGNRPRGAPHA